MRVYIHGNCQAPALARLIGECFPNWEIESYEVFSKKIIDEIDHFHDLVQTADIVISQPVHNGYRNREDLSSDWLRSSVKPSASFVTFPSMFFDGQLVGCRSIKIPAYGMDYHDALLVHLVMADVADSQIIDILLSEDLYSRDFIEQEMRLALSEMQRREEADGVDILLSHFIENYSASIQLFHAINHPCRPALAHIASGILSHLGFAKEVSAIGKDYLPYPHIPCAPSVACFMQGNGAGPAGWHLQDGHQYHLSTHKLSPSDYFKKAIERIKEYSNNEVLGYLKERQNVRSFLERLALARPSLPRIDIWLH